MPALDPLTTTVIYLLWNVTGSPDHGKVIACGPSSNIPARTFGSVDPPDRAYLFSIGLPSPTPPRSSGPCANSATKSRL